MVTVVTTPDRGTAIAMLVIQVASLCESDPVEANHASSLISRHLENMAKQLPDDMIRYRELLRALGSEIALWAHRGAH